MGQRRRRKGGQRGALPGSSTKIASYALEERMDDRQRAMDEALEAFATRRGKEHPANSTPIRRSVLKIVVAAIDGDLMAVIVDKAQGRLFNKRAKSAVACWNSPIADNRKPHPGLLATQMS